MRTKFMIDREYLTIEQRSAYFKELSLKQQRVLEEYKRLQFNSRVLTEINQTGTEWQLIEELIYLEYDIHNQLTSPYICNCGKHVKYLYVCKSASSGEIKNFGSKHLKDEAKIPQNIIHQVNKLHHKIDRGLDIILYYFHQGKRFPKKNYELALRHAWLNADNFNRNQLRYMIAFKKVNLPLYAMEEQKLTQLAEEYNLTSKTLKKAAEAKQIHRKKKKEFWKQKRLEKKRIAKQRIQKAKEHNHMLTPMYAEVVGSKDFSRLKEKMRLCFAKVIRFRVREANLYKLDVMDLTQRLAIYSIFNLGCFDRGDIINNYQEAYKVALELLNKNVELYKQIENSSVIKDEIMRCYKILYGGLKVIGKNENGHPIALNQVER